MTTLVLTLRQVALIESALQQAERAAENAKHAAIGASRATVEGHIKELAELAALVRASRAA